YIIICDSVRLLFFFSSRRRHTCFARDWGSDGCSSDLAALIALGACATAGPAEGPTPQPTRTADAPATTATPPARETPPAEPATRSEERRVGKEYRTRLALCDSIDQCLLGAGSR